jgi:hypothetical protein
LNANRILHSFLEYLKNNDPSITDEHFHATEGILLGMKRKLKWFLKVEDQDGNELVANHRVHKAERPSYEVAERELDLVTGERVLVPGMQRWNPLTTYSKEENAFEEFYMLALREPEALTVTLSLRDAYAEPVEIWTLNNAILQGINWGDMDMEGDGEIYQECTWRFHQAEVAFEPHH